MTLTTSSQINPSTLSTINQPRRTGSILIWGVIGCVILAASGTTRMFQERWHEVERSYKEECPFPLHDLPTTLGGWKLMPGEDRTLDKLTIRITGGTDHILRTYVDELTGVSLVVLVLFGPAELVLPHTPEICYPSSGYRSADETSDRSIVLDDGKKTSFQAAVYQKSGGRAMVREGVYHSFRLDGEWSPWIGSGRKFPRRNPGVFKIQVQRRVVEGERRDRDEPIEKFLALMIGEIEARISKSTATGPSTATTDRSGDNRGPAVRESGDALALRDRDPMPE